MNMRRAMAGLLAALAWSAAWATAEGLQPGDWPCWRGTDRSGVSRDTGLLRQWPDGGPRLCWKTAGLGEGYSAPSVVGGRAYLLGSTAGDEFLYALDVRDGKRLWATRVGRVGENRGPNYPGPRSTPTVDGDALYALGSDGDLVCAEAATGKVRWRRHLEKDFGGKRGVWAYAESPLIDGDVLVCTPGGPTHTLVGLRKRDASLLWRTAIEDYNAAGYASPVVAQVGPIKLYVQFLGSGTVGVDARTGRRLFRYRGNIGGISAAAPIVHDGHVFTSASGTDDVGGDALLRLTVRGPDVRAEEVYLLHNLANHHGGVIRLGEALYGTGRAGLVCLDFRTGAVHWRNRSVGQGALVAADGLLFVRSERGEVALVEATPAGYRERGRFSQPNRSRFPTFTHPVVANGRLYLRDADQLLCYDVRSP